MKKKNLILIIVFMCLMCLPTNTFAANKCKSGYTQVGIMCQKVTDAYQRNGQHYCPPDGGTLDSINKKCVLSYLLESNTNNPEQPDKTTQCEAGYISDGSKCYKIITSAKQRNGEYYCDTPNTYLIGTSCVEASVKDVIDNNTENKNDNNNNTKPSTGNEIKNQYIGNITCGGLSNFTFHKRVPKLTSTLYNLLKVAIPVILVIKGMMDMFKAMSAGKEDEMKKAQKKFINRLIAAVCAFIVFVLVETVIGWISARTGNENAMKCVDCFINNKCGNN